MKSKNQQKKKHFPYYNEPKNPSTSTCHLNEHVVFISF